MGEVMGFPENEADCKRLYEALVEALEVAEGMTITKVVGVLRIFCVDTENSLLYGEAEE